MDHDLENYTKVTFKGKGKFFGLLDVQIQYTERVKDLETLVLGNFFWKRNKERNQDRETLMAAITVLHFRKILIDAQNEDQTWTQQVLDFCSTVEWFYLHNGIENWGETAWRRGNLSSGPLDSEMSLMKTNLDWWISFHCWCFCN